MKRDQVSRLLVYLAIAGCLVVSWVCIVKTVRQVWGEHNQETSVAMPECPAGSALSNDPATGKWSCKALIPVSGSYDIAIGRDTVVGGEYNVAIGDGLRVPNLNCQFVSREPLDTETIKLLQKALKENEDSIADTATEIEAHCHYAQGSVMQLIHARAEGRLATIGRDNVAVGYGAMQPNTGWK